MMWIHWVQDPDPSATLAAVKGQIKRMHDPFYWSVSRPFLNETFASKFCMAFTCSSSHFVPGGKNVDILYERICLLLLKITFQMVSG
jgi:hypothetical protein